MGGIYKKQIKNKIRNFALKVRGREKVSRELNFADEQNSPFCGN